ncbi:MAG: hypothetical protein PHR28_11150, partial [candidate division Zixibacteria bacterium]|nr:hypothetical protein [candidate division Zixibacteria bacterium]
EAVDLAIIAVPGKIVNSVVLQCAEKKVKGVIVISAGFSEDMFPDAFREYTRLLYEAGDTGHLRQVVEKWLVDNPNDVDARRLLESIEHNPPPGTIPAPGSGS